MSVRRFRRFVRSSGQILLPRYLTNGIRVVFDSGPLPSLCMRSSTKRRYVTYCTVIKEGPSHGHELHVQKISWNLYFLNARLRTDRQTDRHRTSSAGKVTLSSAIAERPHNALCQLTSCQPLHSCTKTHLKRHAIGEWPWRSLKVIRIAAVW